MKIPADDYQKLELYREVVDACFYSRERRISQYETLRHYWLYGCSPEMGATPYNKVEPVVDTLSSFLYGADSTRFTVSMPTDASPEKWDMAVPIASAVNDQWKKSGADQLFGQGVDLALVFCSAFVKSIVKGRKIFPYIVEPHCIGVYREDVVGLDRQEAIAHRYYITKSQLRNEIANHPNRDELLRKMQPGPKQPRDEMPESLRRIIVTNMAGVSPLSPGNTVTGNASLILSERLDYDPHIAAEVIEMTELWIRDDQAGDWRTVTMAEGPVVIYDRANVFMPESQPFNQICPLPMNGYFWGGSFAGKLIGLQQWRNTRIGEIQLILAQQAEPPTAITGYTGPIDEMNFALNQPGGVLNMIDPMGKVQRFDRPVPGDLWADVVQIDSMFAEAAALPPLLMGRGETGVRSERQTSTLSKLGSARIKRRALAVEDNLDALATKWYQAMRRFDDTKYKSKPLAPTRKSTTFALSQAPEGATIQVDGHSNSPLFSENTFDLAFALFKAGAIDREELLDMVDPPMRELALQRLKGIEETEKLAAAARQAQEMALANAGTKTGPVGGVSKPKPGPTTGPMQ